MKFVDDEITRVKMADEVYIYGTGDVAKEVGFCLMNPPYQIKIEAFVVSDISEIKEKIFLNKPVLAYTDIADRKNALVVVAVLEKYRDEIDRNLDSIGINKRSYITFESDLWCEIRGEYFSNKSQGKGNKKYIWLEQELYEEMGDKVGSNHCEDDVKVYVAKSHVDKKLRERFDNRTWEENIQVGAALTDARVCAVTDNNGDNISEKNRQYCELTALYWIWKNTHSDIVGLSHYRRRFILSDNEINALAESDIDAVFTPPMLNEPNVEFMYSKNHSLRDWEIMKEAVYALEPDYVSSVNEIEKSESYIPYNMFIMKRNFLNTYCEWLFPILGYCEDKIGKKEDVYQNRYVGFLAERLMSVYFAKNVDKYKMVFAHKHFIETEVA
jgi:hypothetical protein